MKRAKITRKLMALGGALVIGLSILICPVTSLPVQAAAPGDNTAEPMHDKIEWRWKIENNKLYKRLYNYGSAEWVGDWIYVRDL